MIHRDPACIIFNQNGALWLICRTLNERIFLLKSAMLLPFLSCQAWSVVAVQFLLTALRCFFWADLSRCLHMRQKAGGKDLGR